MRSRPCAFDLHTAEHCSESSANKSKSCVHLSLNSVENVFFIAQLCYMGTVKTTRSAVQGGVAAEAHLSGKYKYNNCKDYKNSNHVFLIQGIVKTISNHLLICRRRWTSKGIFLQAASVCSQMGEVALLMHPCHQMGLWSNQVRWLF